MVPRASTTISFDFCSARVTIDPFGSWRRHRSPGHEQPAVGQPVDGVPHQLLLVPRGGDLGPAVQVDGHDLPVDPVAEPQPALVPPRRLGNAQTLHQDRRLGHGASSLRQVTPTSGRLRYLLYERGLSRSTGEPNQFGPRMWSANMVTASSMRRMYRSPPGSLASCWPARPTTTAVQRSKSASLRSPARARVVRTLASTSTASA